MPGKKTAPRGVRRTYDKKIVDSRKSSERTKTNRRKLLVVLAWLVLCVIVGVIFYNTYAKGNMSDVPKVAIRIGDGVTTGNELLKGVDFGPWGTVNAEK